MKCHVLNCFIHAMNFQKIELEILIFVVSMFSPFD